MAEGLSVGEWAVLGLIAEKPTHGFAVAQLLTADGELGRVWTLPRPAVYQVLGKLTARGLVTEGANERSDVGPARRIVSVTPDGRARLQEWLAQPVAHVRDLRSMLLLKLALLDRCGADPRELLIAQRDRLAPQLAALEAAVQGAAGLDRVVLDYRVANSRAAVEFVDSVLRVVAE